MHLIPTGKFDGAWLVALAASVLVACEGAESIDAEDPEAATATTTVTGALSAGGLSLTGSAMLHPLTAKDFAYAHLFDGTIRLTNNTTRTVTIDKQLFFFAAPGGFVWKPDRAVWWTTPLPAGGAAEGAGGWLWGGPVAHLVMRVDGRTSSGTPVAALAGIPLVAPNFAPPGPSPFVDDVNVGVQGPVEIVNLTSGERWLGVTGSVVDTTQTATAAPTITVRARNASGATVATLAQTFGPNEGLPFYSTFVASAALPQGASVADIRVTASLGIFNGTASQTRTFPVVTASPTAIVSPVAGADWLWNNGPGEPFWHAHSGGPEARHAYDICAARTVNGQLQTYAGDPTVNSSYFCWDQPIRAAMTGTVVSVVDTIQDNNGNTHDHDENKNNEIIIQHPNNVFTRYAHMRRGTATVTVGQTVYAGSVIALVGNAGASDAPHLHFHTFKIDATGRQTAVPITVPGMRSASGASVTGIPKGGFIYRTP